MDVPAAMTSKPGPAAFDRQVEFGRKPKTGHIRQNLTQRQSAARLAAPIRNSGAFKTDGDRQYSTARGQWDPAPWDKV